MQLNYLASLSHYIPELLAVVTMIALLFIESTYEEDEEGRDFLYSSAYLGLFSVLVMSILNLDLGATGIFTNSMVIDPFSSVMKIIMVLGTMGAIYLNRESKDIYPYLKAEFVILAVGVLIGGMILSSANNLLMTYIGIETLSILSYVMASLRKNDERSSEAGLKYSLYGGISSGIMLFGMSHIFGALGTINYTEMMPLLGQMDTMQVAILIPSFLLFFVGIGYKIACVPFHMWSPDVYEGSPIPVTTFFAIVPKIGGMAVLLRVTMTFFNQEGVFQDSWIGVLGLIAALTMTVGNVSAINQSSVKRMLAYSSIGHAGVMILGAIVVNQIGVRAVVFYGIAYLFMTLVAFYVTSFIQDKYGNDHYDRFNGLAFRYPLVSILMAIVLFSLAGIPPFSGFVAKFNIFAAIIEQQHYTLAVIAGINSVISLYYYMRIVRVMVFKSPDAVTEGITGFGFVNQSVILVLTLPVVVLGIFWSKIMMIADGAKIFIQ